MLSPRWAEGLSAARLYYDGVIDDCKLQDTLEHHKRDTVSTFGTRSSRRVSTDAQKVLSEPQVVSNGKCGICKSDVAPTATDKDNVNPHGSCSCINSGKSTGARRTQIIYKFICHRNVLSFIGSTQSANILSSLRTLLLVLERNGHSTVSSITSLLVIECSCKGQEKKKDVKHTIIEIMEFNVYFQHSVKSVIAPQLSQKKV